MFTYRKAQTNMRKIKENSNKPTKTVLMDWKAQY